MTNSAKDGFYQVVGFHFMVNFASDSRASVDVKFQSVTGLDSTLEFETVKEGGENRYEHVLPTRRKFGPLVLKRGLLGPGTSLISNWLSHTFRDEPFDYEAKGKVPAGTAPFKVIPTVTIHLLGEGKEDNPLMTWTINNVWPRSWKIGEMNAERGEVLIETLELNYNYLVCQEVKPFNPPRE